MRIILLALSVLSLSSLPAYADDLLTGTAPANQAITAPTEVGSTSMPPGQYLVTDQVSAKSYSLTVTSRGTMILGPAPTTTTTPGAAAGVAGAVGATGATVAGTPASAASTVKGLMQQGLERGATELMKMQGKNTIQNLLK